MELFVGKENEVKTSTRRESLPVELKAVLDNLVPGNAILARDTDTITHRRIVCNCYHRSKRRKDGYKYFIVRTSEGTRISLRKKGKGE